MSHLIAAILLNHGNNAKSVADILDVMSIDEALIIQTQPQTPDWHIFLACTVKTSTAASTTTIDFHPTSVETLLATEKDPIAQAMNELQTLWNEDPEVEALIHQLGLSSNERPQLWLISETGTATSLATIEIPSAPSSPRGGFR